MKNKITSMGNVSPVAYIAKNKQRIKQYEDTVYLKNGDEFQLELFNPTKNKVLAKIELNGNSIGSGMVLRPGERVFLDRYISEAKKFLFDTYMVDGNDKEVKKAIESNGDVVVRFHKEESVSNNHLNPNYIPWTNPYIYNSPSTMPPYNVFTTSDFCFNTEGVGNSITTAASGYYTSTGNVGLGCTNPTSTLTITSVENSSSTLKMETGRIEKGSNSNQKFDTDNSNFECGYSWKSEWKILPESTKNITAQDLVEYCCSCGRKRRKNNKENYCPSCGYKF